MGASWKFSLITGAMLSAPIPRFTDAKRVDNERATARSIANYTALDHYRAREIKDAFRTAWWGYYKYAFPNDELRPVNNTFTNGYAGWGLTVVDALDTAIIMGLDDIVNKSLDFIATIDYTHSKTEEPCSLFETNIRHLGGLLSAYDLFTGPMTDMAQQRSKVDTLLEQACSLADTLKYAFDTPTGIPRNYLFLNNRSYAGDDDDDNLNNVAQIGTLVLEWTRLSDLTGDAEYGRLAQRGESYILRPNPPSVGEIFPGLVGFDLDVRTGLFTSSFGGWIGGVDSYYEYLIKAWVYDPDRFGEYRDRWIAAADSTIKYLTSHPNTRPELTFLLEYNGTQPLIPTSQHLACFAGGNFLLGGLTLGRQDYVDYGMQLTYGCEQIYNQTATQLGPDEWAWLPANNATPGPAGPVPTNQTGFYRRAGFYLTDPTSAIGAEAVESFYYAWRLTGDRGFLEYIYRAFVAMQTHLRVGSGYSPIIDVNVPGSRYQNSQPSFFLAETLKYMYLAHRPDIDVGFSDDVDQGWVFNTEAHPFRVVRGSDNA